MTPSSLKYHVEQAGHDSHFFTRKTMKFFGDTMRNYGVRKATIQARSGLKEVWELYRKRPVLHGLTEPAYFDQSTFARVFEEN